MNSVNEIAGIMAAQRSFFDSGRTREISFRLNQLKNLRRALDDFGPALEEALQEDLGKHPAESYMTELGFVRHSITQTIRRLRLWAAPMVKPTPLYLWPGRSEVRYEPYGTVLIIGPFNYPLHLLFEPLIGAIAAGNTAVLKPSRQTPHVDAVVQALIAEAFPPDYIACVQGGREVQEVLLKSGFDYIFFTGSTKVGKKVLSAAAETLTPVTLELGGKSPVIIDETANLKEAARRIVWGKCLNAGQTCVAPDYALVPENCLVEFMVQVEISLTEFYGPDAALSPDYGRIVSAKEWDRLAAMIDADATGILSGGGRNREERYIEPTFILVDSLEAATMQGEIFGPILPIITYRSPDEAIALARKLPKPLALYIFSKNHQQTNKTLNSVSAGGACVNGTLLQLTNLYLPFGGVGPSGMGAYHGRESFLTFSHTKSVFRQLPSVANPVMYPPYTKLKTRLAKLFLR